MSSHSASVFMVADDAAHNESKLIKLRNPYLSEPSYFLIDQKNGKLYEIQDFDEKCRSWFIKENLLSEGCIKICTPYNPTFLILPYLMKSKRNVPLHDLLEDDEYPKTTILDTLTEDLSHVADRKGPRELNVWVYNEESTLNWLSEKVEKMASLLQSQNERPSPTCAISSDKETYRVLAYSILSESLCEELGSKLKTRLKLPEKALNKTDIDHGNEANSKKAKLDDSPSETVKKNKPPMKQSAKEKALAKSAKGSKSIKSFFSKK